MVSKPQPCFHRHIQRATAKFLLPGSEINHFTAVKPLMSYHSQGTATRHGFYSFFKQEAQQRVLNSSLALQVLTDLTQKFPKLLLPLECSRCTHSHINYKHKHPLGFTVPLSPWETLSLPLVVVLAPAEELGVLPKPSGVIFQALWGLWAQPSWGMFF